MNPLDLLLAICLGVGLAAACGFRVFLPLLITSIALQQGWMPTTNLAPGFEWVATRYATIAFGLATALEVGGYYIPWLDNLLDSIATPAAVVAGTLVTASFLGGMGPLMQWGVGVLAGGGAAAATQVLTVTTRAASTATTATTGGVGNPVVATAEAASATALTILALVAAPLAALLVILACVWIIRRLFHFRARPHRHTPTTPPTPPTAPAA